MSFKTRYTVGKSYFANRIGPCRGIHIGHDHNGDENITELREQERRKPTGRNGQTEISSKRWAMKPPKPREASAKKKTREQGIRQTVRPVRQCQRTGSSGEPLAPQPTRRRGIQVDGKKESTENFDQSAIKYGTSE